jgi:hypothetical protein
MDADFGFNGHNSPVLPCYAPVHMSPLSRHHVIDISCECSTANVTRIWYIDHYIAD